MTADSPLKLDERTERTDTERLDWMGDYYARFRCASWTADRRIDDQDVTVAWTAFDRYGHSEKRETTARPDFRTAIDRAIAESEQAREQEFA